MEDIAADDDLLSDMLVDSLEYDPRLATHKMNQAYRSPRYKTDEIINLVRVRVVIEQDVPGAVEELCRTSVVQKHLAGKSERQRQEFKYHAKRYLETYLPESGVEFALTMRYKKASLLALKLKAESSRAGQANAEARERVRAAEAAATDAAGSSRPGGTKGKARADGNTEVLGTDLCVVATKPFKAGDLVKLCKGGVKDLTKAEDEALKEEAAQGRERRKEQSYNGVLGPGRDFSIIRSSRKQCSQLLLGPARFVNHDCNPNCEFYRTGQSNMMFRCLRDIGINEEITTFYGENYFESGNSECMCLTCEERGNGIFVSEAIDEIRTNPTSTSADSIPESDCDAKRQRRVSMRKPKSPPPVPQPAPKVTLTIVRKGKEESKTFNHCISFREDDGDVFPHPGSRFTCVTCGEPSWGVEEWWSPDECKRCEHHYRIFKADWPSRSPTEGEWSDKVRASRLRKQLADEARSAKSSDVSISSGGTTPEVDSPISLEPLTGPRQSNGSGNKEKKGKSSVSSAIERKKPAKRPAIDEDAVVSVDNSDNRKGRVTAVKHKKSRISRDSDADSDLTSTSGNDGDSTVHAIRPSDRSSPSSSSSTSGDRPCGPKSLGKHAKTETLAMFWGAAENNKRARKPVNNGLESLSSNVQRPQGSKHRRTASDMMTLSPSKRDAHSPTLKVDDATEERFSLPPSGQNDRRNSPFALNKGIGTETMLFRTVSDSQARVLHKRDPQVDAGGLATRGPERTSNSNLAKAWGADLEGGRGSRRRVAARMSTPSAVSSPKREHRSDGCASRETGSETPPSSRKPGATDKSMSRPGTPPSAAILTKLLTDSVVQPPGVSKSIPEKPLSRMSSPALGQAETSEVTKPMHSPAPTSLSNVPQVNLPVASAFVKSESSSPTSTSSSSMTAPRVMHNYHATPLPAQTDKPGTDQSSGSLSTLSTPVPDVPFAQRPFSPLAGASPPSFTGRPGIVPGQPIRKNLRWGKGKVSSSRPLVPGGGLQALAGPAAGYGGGSRLAGPAAPGVAPAASALIGPAAPGASVQKQGAAPTPSTAVQSVPTAPPSSDNENGKSAHSLTNGFGLSRTTAPNGLDANHNSDGPAPALGHVPAPLSHKADTSAPANGQDRSTLPAPQDLPSGERYPGMPNTALQNKTGLQ